MKTLLVILSFLSLSAFSTDVPEEFIFQLDSIQKLDASAEKAQALNDLAWKTKYIDIDFTADIVEQSIELSNANKYFAEAGMAHKLAGILSDEQGLYTEAIYQYQLAIKAYRAIDDEMGIAKCEGNMGMIYRNINNFDQAFKYFKKSNKTFEENDFPYGVMLISMNIGITYFELNKIDSAYYHFKKAEYVMYNIGASDANVYGNLGNVYYKMDSLDLAEAYMLKTVDIFEQTQPGNYNIKVWYQNLGALYKEKGDREKAKVYYLKALDYTEDYYNREATFLLLGLADLNRIENNYKISTHYYRMLNTVKDSIYSVENISQMNELASKYESEKQELQIQALDKEKKLESAKRAAEENKVFYFTIGSILLGVLFLFVIYGLFVKSKDNKKIRSKNLLIESQKEILELKNHEITSSIEYAKRIQSAILPPLKLVKSYFENSFVLYKPKDIVAGDFYWFETDDNHVVFAAADCTGHGVPGAMVSVICHNALSRSFREFKLTEPGEILNKTRELVIDQFDNSEETVKDGMDIALCSYNIKTRILKYSGANNPLWIVRKGTAEIEEIKANKQPVGNFHKNQEFDSHEVIIGKGDTFYLFSDGYADQFGGKDGKKFKSKSFKKLILTMQNKKMGEQREAMDEFFENWKGELEQLDDVCVIGVRF